MPNEVVETSARGLRAGVILFQLPGALGAGVRDEHDTFTVMLDPEGNEFCVLDPR